MAAAPKPHAPMQSCISTPSDQKVIPSNYEVKSVQMYVCAGRSGYHPSDHHLHRIATAYTKEFVVPLMVEYFNENVSVVASHVVKRMEALRKDPRFAAAHITVNVESDQGSELAIAVGLTINNNATTWANTTYRTFVTAATDAHPCAIF
jgi:hypothetical protein